MLVSPPVRWLKSWGGRLSIEITRISMQVFLSVPFYHYRLMGDEQPMARMNATSMQHASCGGVSPVLSPDVPANLRIMLCSTLHVERDTR
jgi:hypothetical protein